MCAFLLHTSLLLSKKVIAPAKIMGNNTLAIMLLFLILANDWSTIPMHSYLAYAPVSSPQRAEFCLILIGFDYHRQTSSVRLLWPVVRSW